jgi:hypothetical protein
VKKNILLINLHKQLVMKRLIYTEETKPQKFGTKISLVKVPHDFSIN